MILWKVKDKATGLNHHVRTSLSPSTATTFCKRPLTVDWTELTEMPSTAVVTCLECVASDDARR